MNSSILKISVLYRYYVVEGKRVFKILAVSLNEKKLEKIKEILSIDTEEKLFIEQIYKHDSPEGIKKLKKKMKKEEYVSVAYTLNTEYIFGCARLIGETTNISLEEIFFSDDNYNQAKEKEKFEGISTCISYNVEEVTVK